MDAVYFKHWVTYVGSISQFLATLLPPQNTVEAAHYHPATGVSAEALGATESSQLLWLRVKALAPGGEVTKEEEN